MAENPDFGTAKRMNYGTKSGKIEELDNTNPQILFSFVGNSPLFYMGK